MDPRIREDDGGGTGMANIGLIDEANHEMMPNMKKPQIRAIYLCVKKMDRAVQFYEEIFEQKVTSFGKRMSVFKFKNISFLLYNPKIDGERVVFGNNVVPNIEVADIRKTLKLIKKCKIIVPLITIEGYQIAQIKDPEGNVIEFYHEVTKKLRML